MDDELGAGFGKTPLPPPPKKVNSLSPIVGPILSRDCERELELATTSLLHKVRPVKLHPISERAESGSGITVRKQVRPRLAQLLFTSRRHSQVVLIRNPANPSQAARISLRSRTRRLKTLRSNRKTNWSI